MEKRSQEISKSWPELKDINLGSNNIGQRGLGLFLSRAASILEGLYIGIASVIQKIQV